VRATGLRSRAGAQGARADASAPRRAIEGGKMTAAWMAYALVVGSVVALAAYAMDRVCALANRPARWIWAVAMAFTLVLVMLAPRRDARVTAEVVLPLQLSTTEVSAEAAQQTTLELARASLARLRASIESAAASTFAAVGRLTSRR